MRLKVQNPALTYVAAAYPKEEKISFDKNNQWYHKIGDYEAIVYNETSQTYVNGIAVTRTYEILLYDINIDRINDGIVTRLLSCS